MYKPFNFKLWLFDARCAEKNIADEIARSIEKEIFVQDVRVMSRHSNVIETERVASCVRRLPPDLRTIVGAICSDINSAIFLVVLFDNQRTKAQALADILRAAVLEEFGIDSTMYVADNCGPVGIFESHKAF